MKLNSFLIFVFFLFSHKRVKSQNANCSRAIDLLLIVDSSGSVGINFFNQAKEAMKLIVNRFNIGKNNALFGIINYSSHVENVLSLVFQHQTWSQSLVTSAIDNMAYHNRGTATGDAFNSARNNIFSFSRSIIPKLAIVFTDGKSNSGRNVLNEAQLLKDDGVDIFAVGVGDGINQNELESIASIPKSIYKLHISGYDALFNVINNITQIACDTNAFIPLNTSVHAIVAVNEQKYYQVNFENYKRDGYAHIKFQHYIGRTNIYLSIIEKNPKSSNLLEISTTLKGKNEYFVYIPAGVPRLYLTTHGMEEKNEVKFEDGPYEFVLEELEEKIIITAILEDGIIFKHGGIKVGDELIDINGLKLKGCSILNCVDILEMEISNKNKKYIEITVLRENTMKNEMSIEKSKSLVEEEVEELDEEV